jgi:hypothetical protein
MTEDRAPRESSQRPGKANKEKKVYQKPAFRFEHVFETQALSCGKVGSSQGKCAAGNRSAS